uniref:E3 ubiquitin ligase UBR4 C-terminal domain-containing protein n=1 Tax=Timema cristinae TaxID=61476 RepID=A0A7R9H883_TIMCR|nr:unnamed protein product [Timema cristinae]
MLNVQIMLDRLSAIKDIARARPLLQVLLKLFRLCVKVQRNQEVLIQSQLGAISVFLGILQLCLAGESDASQGTVTEQLLDVSGKMKIFSGKHREFGNKKIVATLLMEWIMETILSKAASQPLETFLSYSQTFGGPEHVHALLTCTTAAGVRGNASVLLHLTKVLAALTYGNAEKMALLCDHFKVVTDFNKFDFEHTPDDEQKLELLCVLATVIERNAIGNTLKDHIISLGFVSQALDYVSLHAPSLEQTQSRTDSDDWKEFISKPALKYILRFLTGLATEHEPTQLAVSAQCIPTIHQLEQVSSDEHVGSLAENLLEALRAHPQVASRIEEVREETRAVKKRLAMAMREKQLGALGMRTNEKGQVTAKSTLLMEDLGEETGLVCVICREGYKFQPTKVLGVYTFTKRCNVEEFETKPRKTVGYSTVTHFNVVHVDCHMSAVSYSQIGQAASTISAYFSCILCSPSEIAASHPDIRGKAISGTPEIGCTPSLSYGSCFVSFVILSVLFVSSLLSNSGCCFCILGQRALMSPPSLHSLSKSSVLEKLLVWAMFRDVPLVCSERTPLKTPEHPSLFLQYELVRPHICSVSHVNRHYWIPSEHTPEQLLLVSASPFCAKYLLEPWDTCGHLDVEVLSRRCNASRNNLSVDCSRLARARDEWESAALQNANTKCNGLLPLWGPQVPESAFASCLARHNTYLQECTGHRFATEKSFHDDTGGGGPQSNMHMIPYLIHMALYVINTPSKTRSGPREDKNLTSYLDSPGTDKWVESCYDAEGPLYWSVLSLLLHPPSHWARARLTHLRRLVVLAHARHCQPAGPTQKLLDISPRDYSVYKSYLVFFGLVDAIYANCLKKVSVASDDQWPSTLADYIRHNDEALLKASERLLATYREELLPCTSFEEFCDVTGLCNKIRML